MYYLTNGVFQGIFGAIDSDGTGLFIAGGADMWWGEPIISGSGTFYANNAYTGLSTPLASGGATTVFNLPQR